MRLMVSLSLAAAVAASAALADPLPCAQLAGYYQCPARDGEEAHVIEITQQGRRLSAKFLGETVQVDGVRRGSGVPFLEHQAQCRADRIVIEFFRLRELVNEAVLSGGGKTLHYRIGGDDNGGTCVDPRDRWGLTPQDWDLLIEQRLVERAGMPARFKEALELAQRGDARAMLLASDAHYTGVGTAQNYAEAARWAREAVARGEHRAHHRVGLLLRHGRGVKQDLAAALRHYRAGAAAGDPWAAYRLGHLYWSGAGVAKNVAQAFEHWFVAAEAGLAIAQHNVALMFAHGEGVEHSPYDARHWMERAAAQDFAMAQGKLKLFDLQREIAGTLEGTTVLEIGRAKYRNTVLQHVQLAGECRSKLLLNLRSGNTHYWHWDVLEWAGLDTVNTIVWDATEGGAARMVFSHRDEASRRAFREALARMVAACK